MSKKTAFITGAEGFIGSHLTELLHTEGWAIVAGHLPHDFKNKKHLPNLKYEQCDLRNGRRLAEILDRYRPSHIFHLGAQSLPVQSWADPVWTFECNIMGSLNLLEAARYAYRKPTIVSACSSAEYGHVHAHEVPIKEECQLRPLHPYGISKVCQDLLGRQYFLDFGLKVVNIRLFNTTGPGKTNDAPSDFVRQLIRIKRREQKPVIEVGNLEPLRAYLDVADTVRGFYLAAQRGEPGESYNLCATRTRSVGEILRAAISISGIHADIRPVKRLMRPSDEKIIFGSTRKFAKRTGWRPERTLEETLQTMLDYWDRSSIV